MKTDGCQWVLLVGLRPRQEKEGRSQGRVGSSEQELNRDVSFNKEQIGINLSCFLR